MRNKKFRRVPGPLWDALEKIAELISSGEDVTLDMIIPESELTIENVLGQLWNCTATVPSSVIDLLDDSGVFEDGVPDNHSYSSIVRRVKNYLEES
jgi:hypothetical protein